MRVVGVVCAGDRVKAEVCCRPLVACIGGYYGETPVQRIAGCGLRAYGRANHPVVTATALVEQATIPLHRQTHFKTDVVGFAVLTGAFSHAAREFAMRCQQGASGSTRRAYRVTRNLLYL